MFASNKYDLAPRCKIGTSSKLLLCRMIELVATFEVHLPRCSLRVLCVGVIKDYPRFSTVALKCIIKKNHLIEKYI